MACVGGGSNAIGLFTAFLKDRKVKMVGVEAGGLGIESGKHGLCFASGMSASAAVLDLLDAGSHVVAMHDLYGMPIAK